MEEKKVSKSVLKRLPGYLAYLKNMPENAPAHISATALANALGMGEVQVRKDLAMVSDGGRPKIGYLRETLIDDIEQFLGYDNTTDAVHAECIQSIIIFEFRFHHCNHEETDDRRNQSDKERTQ